jgi:hypothetical protein
MAVHHVIVVRVRKNAEGKEELRLSSKKLRMTEKEKLRWVLETPLGNLVPFWVEFEGVDPFPGGVKGRHQAPDGDDEIIVGPPAGNVGPGPHKYTVTVGTLDLDPTIIIEEPPPPKP